MSLDKYSLERSRWSKQTSRAIEILCFVALLVVMGTVIYGFALRAYWAHSYYLAMGLAVIGAAVILIGLAQQAIAARDAATWRSMAEWQIRAARGKITGSARQTLPGEEDLDPDSPVYYEHLVEALLENGQRDDAEALR